MSCASIRELVRMPLPDWFPGEERIRRMLAKHEPVYRWHRPRYAVQLLADLALLLPQGTCRLLDVGGGSGLIGEAISTFSPGKTVTAIDVVDRFLPTVTIKRRTFDGKKIPFADLSFDCALFSNVLHHVPSELRSQLVSEALRVTGGACVIVKDHVADSVLDRARLAWLDLVGNLPFRGVVQAEYLSMEDWHRLFVDTGCNAERLTGSPYRTGPGRVFFPNRLEVLFRLGLARCG